MTYLEAENTEPNRHDPGKYFWHRILWKINKVLSGPPVPIAKHTPCHCGRFFCGERDH